MKYRKKPVGAVEAAQFFPDKKPWPAGVKEELGAACDDPQCGDSSWDHACSAGGPTGRHVVRTAHDQDVVLSPGDWVVPEPNGRGHYPIKPGIFEATYEVDEPEQCVGARLVEADDETLLKIAANREIAETERGRVPKRGDRVQMRRDKVRTVREVTPSGVFFEEDEAWAAREYLATHYEYLDEPERARKIREAAESVKLGCMDDDGASCQKCALVRAQIEATIDTAMRGEL